MSNDILSKYKVVEATDCQYYKMKWQNIIFDNMSLDMFDFGNFDVDKNS
jgi:hypothetical protein